MIHGKKRNGDLFKRLTESWGYTKPETVEEEAVPLDEEMAAESETVTEEEEVVEEEEELKAEGTYKRDEDLDEASDTELEEGGAAARAGSGHDQGKNRALPDRVHEVEASANDEVVEEAEEEVVEAKADEVVEEDADTTDSLEEAIRRVVKEAIKTIKNKNNK